MTHAERSKRKRTPAQIAADAAFFEHWAIRGKTCRQLAEMIAEIRPYTLSRQQVFAELVKLKKQWQESAITERTAAVANELTGLQAQEDELWIAWERSKLDRESRTIESDKKHIGKANFTGTTKKKTTTEGQSGEAAYMRLILEIRDQRRKLLGLDAETIIRDSRDPKEKITISGPASVPFAQLILPAGRAGMKPVEAPAEPPNPEDEF